MAWQAKYIELHSMSDHWAVVVEYYDDVNPDRVFTRNLTLPLSTTRNQLQAQVVERGQELRRIAAISSDRLVGSIVPIP